MSVTINKLKYLLIIIGSLRFNTLFAQDSPQKLISIELKKVSTIDALEQINALDNIKLSFNPDFILNDSTTASTYINQPIEKVLHDVLGEDFEYKYRGSYIIIQKKKIAEQKKAIYKFAGEIRDAETGEVIQDVTVYEVNKFSSTLTDNRGNFELSVSAKTDYVTFAISGAHYMDTLIMVENTEEALSSPLLLRPSIIGKTAVEKVKQFSVETKKLVQLFTTRKSRKNVENVELNEIRPFQFSLVPMVGTNGSLSGKVENKYSVNLIAGYSKGLNGGLELGGLYNIDRKNVKGVQIGGFGNAVGGTTTGAQFAGFVNTNRSFTHGVQAAGFLNIVTDDMQGAQMAGFLNIAKNTSGTQLAGFTNISTQDLDGIQLAGFNNYSKNVIGGQGASFANITGNLYGAQISAGVNYAHSVEGAQIGLINIADSVKSGATVGLLNIATKNTEGAQVSVFANISSKNIQGAQVGGIINIANNIKGPQLSGFMNIAKKVNGMQIGLINIADSVTHGVTLGLLNFVKNGKVEFALEHNDFMDANIAFRSGTDLLYTMFTSGLQVSKNELWSFGMGIGSQIRIKGKLHTNIEVSSHTINKVGRGFEDINLLNRLNLNLGFQVAKHFSINAGPVLNVYVTNLLDEDTGIYGDDWGQSPLQEEVVDNLSISSWIGYAVSFRF